MMHAKKILLLSTLTALALALGACAKKESSASETPAAGKATKATPAPARLEIAVTEKGFEPDHLSVTKGQPVTLVFTRKTDATCAKEVVVDLGGGNKVDKALPLDQPVEIAATFPASGELGYACGMNMVKGVITVQ